MANFNFGQIGEAIQAGRHADSKINTGPVDAASTANLTMLNHDFGDFVTNSSMISVLAGNQREFLWGKKWGSSKMRVAE